MSATQRRTDEVDLYTVGRTLARRWAWIIAAMVLGAVAGAVAAITSRPVYEATATVITGSVVHASRLQTALEAELYDPGFVGNIARS